MVDSVQVWPIGLRVLDASGNPVSGAKLKVFDAGTSTPKTVYSDKDLSVSLGSVVHCDAGGHPVASQGSSTKVVIFTGTALYKLQITTSADVDVVAPIDNLKGALDTSTFIATTALPKTPVVSKTSAFTAVLADRGKVFNCSGATFTTTLDSATNLGDNWRACIRHDDGVAGRQYRIVTTGGNLISFPNGNTHTAFSLTGKGEAIWITCDGSGFVVDTYSPPLFRANWHGMRITDRLSTPPGSPTAGARYILTAAPTGAWSTFAEHDIAEADGQGGWFRTTPTTDCGWTAYVVDEQINYQFRGSAWVQDTASETVAGRIELATAAEVKAGTDTSRAVVPVTLQDVSWVRVDKTADETITASTTFQDDDHLTFAVAANTKYSWRCTIFMTTPAAADWKYQFTGPAAPTAVKYGHIAAEDGAGGEFGVATAFSTSIVVSAVATLWIIELRGRLSNGANAGNVTLQWAQNTSDAGNTIVELGSYLEYIVVP